MPNRSFFGFKMKIAVSFFLIAAIPIIVMAVLFYNSNIKNIKQDGLNKMHKQTISAIDTTNKNFSDIYTFYNHVFSNTTINYFFTKGFYTDIELILKLNNEIAPLVRWINFLKPETIESFQFYTENTAIPPTRYIHELDEIHKGIASEGVYRQHNHPDSKQIFYIAPLNSTVLGKNTYLDIEVNTETAFSPLIKLSEVNGTILQIYNEENGLVYTNTENFALGSTGIPLEESWTEVQTVGDSRYYVSRFQLAEGGFWATVSLPYENIHAALNKMVFSFVFFLFVLIIVFAVFVYAYTDFFLHRLKKIIQTVKTIQTGNFKVKIEHRDKDVIDELAQSINTMSSEIDTLINEVYLAELKEKKMMVSTLQKQINPHFLYNILECIRMKAELNNQEEISDNISCLGSILRYNISVGKNLETLSTEFKNAEDYISIQNLLNNNRLKYKIKLEEAEGSLTIPKFCIQPIIENSISHGMDPDKEFLIMEIEVISNSDFLIIKITDNGVGISPDIVSQMNRDFVDFEKTIPLDMDHGIALYNINARIKLMYGSEYGLSVSSIQGEGVTMSLTLPLLL